MFMSAGTKYLTLLFVKPRVMKKIFTYYFAEWWRPVGFWILSIVLFVISEFISPGQNVLATYEGFLILFGMICLPISADKQIKQNKKTNSVLTWIFFGLSIICLIALFIYGLIVSLGPDHYADNLKIPINLKADSVIDLNDYGNERLTDVKKETVDFQLYKTFQSGCYEFDFWVGKIERGEIYIKVFEITEEDELDDERFPHMQISNPTDSIKRFGTNGYFVINEGDWGVKYAARFEVWFTPINGEADRKLLERNYIIDGWQH